MQDGDNPYGGSYGNQMGGTVSFGNGQATPANQDGAPAGGPGGPLIKETTTVNDLASALNELSLRPRDVIAIFQAIKQAGALNAKLIII